MSQRALSRILGRTTRQIRAMEAEGLPVRADGRRKFYDVAKVVVWFIERERRRVHSGATAAAEREARLRKLQAQARREELEVARLEGSLYTLEEVEQVVIKPLTQLRGQLLALPGRFAPFLPMPPAEAHALLIPLRDQMMNDLADYLRDVMKSIDSDIEPPSPIQGAPEGGSR